MDRTSKDKLMDALLHALTLGWSDNGNIMADAVRDQCISAIAEYVGKSFGEVEAMIEKQIKDSH